jgi:hypothetical protein
VLDVLLPDVLLDGLLGLFGVECELVELNYGLLVALDVGQGGSISLCGLSEGCAVTRPRTLVAATLAWRRARATASPKPAGNRSSDSAAT